MSAYQTCCQSSALRSDGSPTVLVLLHFHVFPLFFLTKLLQNHLLSFYVVCVSKPVVWLHCNEAIHHFDSLASQNL